MTRTIWLAFACLLCLGALGALKAGTGTRTIAAAEAARPPDVEAEPPLAKSDRLPPPPLDRAEKAGVATVKIAPEPPEKASPAAVGAHQAISERTKITSWHWNASSKIIKRTTSQPKSDRER